MVQRTVANGVGHSPPDPPRDPQLLKRGASRSPKKCVNSVVLLLLLLTPLASAVSTTTTRRGGAGFGGRRNAVTADRPGAGRDRGVTGNNMHRDAVMNSSWNEEVEDYDEEEDDEEFYSDYWKDIKERGHKMRHCQIASLSVCANESVSSDDYVEASHVLSTSETCALKRP